MNVIEEKVEKLIAPIISQLGFELVRVRLQGAKSNILEILIDKEGEEKVTIANCRTVSHHISAILDVEDIIRDKYYLEVSSCGIERPLVKFSDYQRFIGNEAKIKLKEVVQERKTHQGKIVSAEDGAVKIEVNKEILCLPFELIREANLVLTDEMFKKLLNKKD